jgi:anti-sigma factor RsiW
MSKDPLYERLREAGWRRKLTPDEQARLSELLATDSELQSDWESEAGLNKALAELAPAPVPNNFTARVLAEAKREAAIFERTRRPAMNQAAWWFRWLPKAAVAAVVLAAGVLSYHHVQETRREEVARSLSAISQIPVVPNPEVLKDFDAIVALGSNPPADEELLRVMQ